jgi:hypothetical protein
LNHGDTTGTTEETTKEDETADERRWTQIILIGVYLRSSAVPTFLHFLGVLGG